MEENKEQQLMLLLFLNWITKRVLQGLKGSFFRTLKNKYNNMLKASEAFEKGALAISDESVKEIFEHYSFQMAEIMNIAIDHYHEKQLDEFIEHCKKFKN